MHVLFQRANSNTFIMRDRSVRLQGCSFPADLHCRRTRNPSPGVLVSALQAADLVSHRTVIAVEQGVPALMAERSSQFDPMMWMCDVDAVRSPWKDICVQRPLGTITFLFTDIEGSTRLLEQAPEAMGAALERHDQILRTAIESHGGYVFATGGDGFAAAFSTAGDALRSGSEAQESLASEMWPVDAESAFGWPSTRARQSSAAETTSVPLSIVPHDYRQPGTGPRCSCRRRRSSSSGKPFQRGSI